MELKRLYSRLALLLLMALMALSSFAAEPLLVPTSPDGVQRAEIIVDSYSYSPDHLIVKANVPVELTLHSKTWLIPHNFLLKSPEAGLDIKKEIPAGETVVIKFTPTRPGKFKFYCDKRFLFFKSHEDRGMKGTLEVRE